MDIVAGLFGQKLDQVSLDLCAKSNDSGLVLTQSPGFMYFSDVWFCLYSTMADDADIHINHAKMQLRLRSK